MAITVGERLPDATFRALVDGTPQEISTADLFGGKRVILFGVPGAFTPTCDRNHLPGYLQSYDEFKAKGIDDIAVVAVNDMFVMNAWAKSAGADGTIIFLADGSAEFTRSVGLELDATGLGMGVRSKRYAMLVEDGVVSLLKVEDNPSAAEESGAQSMLASL